MSNAAEYLLQFFEVEQQPDGFRKDVLSAYTAMCSTERTLDTLIARGVKRLDMAKSQMPGIWKALWESFSEDANGYRMNFSTLAGATDRLDAAAVLALQTIADRWVELDVRMEDKDRENISGFLSEIEQCLKEDVSMPAALKSYVLNLTTEVRRGRNQRFCISRVLVAMSQRIEYATQGRTQTGMTLPAGEMPSRINASEIKPRITEAAWAVT